VWLAGFVEAIPGHVEAHRVADGDGVKLGEYLAELLDGAEATGGATIGHEGDRLSAPRGRGGGQSPA
jgi:hypothetical protein